MRRIAVGIASVGKLSSTYISFSLRSFVRTPSADVYHAAQRVVCNVKFFGLHRRRLPSSSSSTSLRRAGSVRVRLYASHRDYFVFSFFILPPFEFFYLPSIVCESEIVGVQSVVAVVVVRGASNTEPNRRRQKDWEIGREKNEKICFCFCLMCTRWSRVSNSSVFAIDQVACPLLHCAVCCVPHRLPLSPSPYTHTIYTFPIFFFLIRNYRNTEPNIHQTKTNTFSHRNSSRSIWHTRISQIIYIILLLHVIQKPYFPLHPFALRRTKRRILLLNFCALYSFRHQFSRSYYDFSFVNS